MIALSVARWMLFACIAIWLLAVAAALLGAPMGTAYLVAQGALLGMFLSAIAALVIQSSAFLRRRRRGGGV